jgi:hypothetical protein
VKSAGPEGCGCESDTNFTKRRLGVISGLNQYHSTSHPGSFGAHSYIVTGYIFAAGLTATGSICQLSATAHTPYRSCDKLVQTEEIQNLFILSSTNELPLQSHLRLLSVRLTSRAAIVHLVEAVPDVPKQMSSQDAALIQHELRVRFVHVV